MKYHVSMITVALLATTVAGQLQELTKQQQDKLVKVDQGFSHQATVLEGLMNSKFVELATELNREGRLDSEEAAVVAANKVNAIMKGLSGLYGEYIKTKMQYVLETKNTLTNEQKKQLLSQLSPSSAFPYESVEYLQPEVFDQPLNLSLEQKKAIVRLEANLLIKEVELERDVELALLDLQVLLLSGQPQPEKVDPLAMKLADLAGKTVDNRIDFFLKAKDTLNLEQKRMLSELLGLK